MHENNSWDRSGGVVVQDLVSLAQNTAQGRTFTPELERLKQSTKELITPILLTAALGVLAWLALEVHSLGNNQSEMRADLRNTIGRVDRIANEVPTLRHEIAVDRASTPARQVLVTTIPQRLDSAKWIASLHVIDIGLHTSTAHYVTLSSERQVDQFEVAVSGMVVKSAPSALSFGEVAALSSTPSNAIRIPDYVDTASSYVLWSITDSIPIRVLKVTFSVDSTRTSNVTVGNGNWMSVLSAVRSHPRIYDVRPSPPKRGPTP